MSTVPVDDPVADRQRGRLDTLRDLATLVAEDPRQLLAHLPVAVRASIDTAGRSHYHRGCAEATLLVADVAVDALGQVVDGVRAAVLAAEAEAAL